MAAKSLLNSPAMGRQSLLAEFSGLKKSSPPGVYLCIDPTNHLLWNGVLFVRKGPYAIAILRFTVAFPAKYPHQPPLITFTTDVFHPLLTPLTAQESGSTAATRKRLPPGGFSLRHGFPAWFGLDEDGLRTGASCAIPRITVYEVFDYVRKTFDEEGILDGIGAGDAADLGALRAWRSYRGLATTVSNDKESEVADAASCEWNWDGVWESRAKKGIAASLSDQALYGGLKGDDDLIRFNEHEPEEIEFIKGNVKRSLTTVECEQE